MDFLIIVGAILIVSVLLIILKKNRKEDFSEIVVEYHLDSEKGATFYDWLEDGREFEYVCGKGFYFVYFDNRLIGTVRIDDPETLIPVEDGLDLYITQ